LPEAVESAAQMKQRAGDNANRLYNAACLYALCSGAKISTADASPLVRECADEAMTLLSQAVAKGYKDVAHIKQDSDLDALRPRADFQKLLKELQEKK
jgi:hypothetical protein